MDIEKRRREIISILKGSPGAVKGTELAERFKVTRQVIVKDMSVIKAMEPGIVSTSEGYLFMPSMNLYRRVFLVSHGGEKMKDELSVIIGSGGIIEDIVVEHPYYGELKANLYLRSMKDIERFADKFNESGATPLSALTGGEHMHTVAAPEEEILDVIEEELRKRGYLAGE